MSNRGSQRTTAVAAARRQRQQSASRGKRNFSSSFFSCAPCPRWLQDQDIQGSLPPRWSSWKSLTELTLVNVNVTGGLPAEWSQWSSLRYLQLSSPLGGTWCGRASGCCLEARRVVGGEGAGGHRILKARQPLEFGICTPVLHATLQPAVATADKKPQQWQGALRCEALHADSLRPAGWLQGPSRSRGIKPPPGRV